MYETLFNSEFTFINYDFSCKMGVRAMLHIGTGTQKKTLSHGMIHPLHSCKGKGVKQDKRERKREVVYGFRLAVHDAWRCADKKQSRSAS